MAVLEQLKPIHNVRKIRDKVEEIEEIVLTDDPAAAVWDKMSIVNVILLMINNNKEAWNSEVDKSEGSMALLAGKLTYSKMQKERYAKTTQVVENKYALVNIGKKFEGPAPE